MKYRYNDIIESYSSKGGLIISEREYDLICDILHCDIVKRVERILHNLHNLDSNEYEYGVSNVYVEQPTTSFNVSYNNTCGVTSTASDSYCVDTINICYNNNSEGGHNETYSRYSGVGNWSRTTFNSDDIYIILYSMIIHYIVRCPSQLRFITLMISIGKVI